METSSEKGRDSGGDVLNNDDLIDPILSKLPSEDAVRTCLISKSWKDRWTKLPYVVLDGRSRLGCDQNKCIRFVNAMLSRLVSPIQVFALELRTFKSCSEIDDWVIFLGRTSKCRVFRLQLWQGEPHVIHKSLFCFKNITVLHLRHCIMNLPAALLGLKNLQKLVLDRISIDSDHLARLITNSKQLKHLKLFFLDAADVKIDAPQLLEFGFHGNVQLLCLQTPCLAKVGLSLIQQPTNGRADASVNFQNNIDFLSSIEKFVANGRMLKFMAAGSTPKGLPIRLERLRCICLCNFLFTDLNVVSCTIALLQSCPNLEELTIIASSDLSTYVEVEAVVRFLRDDEVVSDFVLDNLSIVRTRSISGSRPEMQFLQLILRHSPALEKLIIDGPYEASSTRILKELNSFQRGSKKAEVLYREGKRN